MSVSMNLAEIRRTADRLTGEAENLWRAGGTDGNLVAGIVADLARVACNLCDVIPLPPAPAPAPAAVAVDDEALVKGMVAGAWLAVPPEGVERTLGAFYEAEARAVLAYLRSQGWGPRQ